MRLSLLFLALWGTTTAQINRSQCLAPVNTHICGELMSQTQNLPVCNCYSFCNGILVSCEDNNVVRRCGDPATFAAGCVAADAGTVPATPNSQATPTSNIGVVGAADTPEPTFEEAGEGEPSVVNIGVVGAVDAPEATFEEAGEAEPSVVNIGVVGGENVTEEEPILEAAGEAVETSPLPLPVDPAPVEAQSGVGTTTTTTSTAVVPSGPISRAQCLAPVNTHLCGALMTNTLNLPSCNCYSFCNGVLVSCADSNTYRRCSDSSAFAAGCVPGDAGIGGGSLIGGAGTPATTTTEPVSTTLETPVAAQTEVVTTANTGPINRSQCLAPVNTHLCGALMRDTMNLPICNCYSFCGDVLVSCEDSNVYRRCTDPSTFAAGCVAGDAGRGGGAQISQAGDLPPVSSNVGALPVTSNTGTAGIVSTNTGSFVQPTYITSNAGGSVSTNAGGGNSKNNKNKSKSKGMSSKSTTNRSYVNNNSYTVISSNTGTALTAAGTPTTTTTTNAAGQTVRVTNLYPNKVQPTQISVNTGSGTSNSKGGKRSRNLDYSAVSAKAGIVGAIGLAVVSSVWMNF